MEFSRRPLRLGLVFSFFLLYHQPSPGAATPAEAASQPSIRQSLNRPPTPTLLQPLAGRGLTQELTTRFSDPDGVADLGVLNVLINRHLDGAQACYLAYDNQSDWVFLVGDDGGSLTGAPRGAVATLQNSQCALDVSAVQATRYGQTLELKFPIVFQAAFHGGRIVHLAARDIHGAASTWQPSGVVYTTEPAAGPAVVSLTGGEGDGTARTLTVAYRKRDGEQLTPNQILVNRELDGRGACYVGYDNVYHNLFLVNDAGDALSHAIQPAHDGLPGAGVVENSQCVIDGALSSAVNIGERLYLSVHMTFKPGFEGRKIVYAASQTSSGRNTGWDSVGSTVTGAPPLAVEVIPADATQNAPVSQRVLFAMQQPLSPSSVNDATVRLFDGGGAVVPATPALSPNGLYISLRPNQNLTTSTDYRAEISGLLYASGAEVPAAATHFRTSDSDSPPQLAYAIAWNIGGHSSFPDGAARNARIVLDFDVPVDPTSFDNASVVHRFGATKGETTFSKGFRRVLFRPEAPLPIAEHAQLKLAAKALSGATLWEGGAVFEATVKLHVTPPAVRSATGALGSAPIDRPIEIHFTEGVDGVIYGDGAVRILCNGLPAPVTNLEVRLSENRAVHHLDSRAGSLADCALIVAGLVSETGVAQVAAYAVGLQPGGTDTEPPRVVSMQPFYGATNVPLDAPIRILFSEPIASIDSEVYLTTENGDVFNQTLDSAQTTLELRPAAPLRPNTRYSIGLGPIVDYAGNRGSHGHRVELTTGSAATDTTPPSVLAVSPPHGAAGLAWNVAIEILFSEGVDEGIAGQVTLRDSSGNVLPLRNGSQESSWPRNKRRYWQDPALPAGGEYSVSVSGFVDAAGNVMTPFSFSFTAATANFYDEKGPAVVSVIPANGAAGISTLSSVVVRLDEPVRPTLLFHTDLSNPLNGCCNSSFAKGVSITLDGVQLPVDHTLSADGLELTATPRKPLLPDTSYQVNVSGLEDWHGRSGSPFSSSFTTGSGPADTTGPEVADAVISDEGVGGRRLIVTFNEPVQRESVDDGMFVLFQGQKLSRWSSSLDGRSYSVALALYAVEETATLVVSSYVRDLSGNPAAPAERTISAASDRKVGPLTMVRPANGPATCRRLIPSPISSKAPSIPRAYREALGWLRTASRSTAPGRWSTAAAR